MSGRFAASDQVAIVGYAQSPVVRHADKPLGAIALDTARAAIADAGLEVAQIDGFTTGAIFPTAGAHTIEDGVSIVSANWMAEHLGVNPRWASGFQGYGQIPGSVELAVNAVASGAADFVLYGAGLPWDHAPGSLLLSEAGAAPSLVMVRRCGGEDAA